ncbi:hypothetical protein [Paenibacillus sp. UNC451MF]|uniref:hypothetical protein n=1 Tax=Paenibacillus sp. UNC451MF TaxID=1449063 RepID=UPI00048F203C|nr:hypothetical protein [Paenibacillus sp. UNC451MF]
MAVHETGLEWRTRHSGSAGKRPDAVQQEYALYILISEWPGNEDVELTPAENKRKRRFSEP